MNDCKMTRRRWTTTRPKNVWGETPLEQIANVRPWQIELGNDLWSLHGRGVPLSKPSARIARAFAFIQESGSATPYEIISAYDEWYKDISDLGDVYNVGQKTSADRPLHIQTAFAIDDDLYKCLELDQGGNKIYLLNHTNEWTSDVFAPGFFSTDHTVVDGAGNAVQLSDRDFTHIFHEYISRSDSCALCCLATDEDKAGNQWKTLEAQLKKMFKDDSKHLNDRDGVMIMSLWGNIDTAFRCLYYHAMTGKRLHVAALSKRTVDYGLAPSPDGNVFKVHTSEVSSISPGMHPNCMELYTSRADIVPTLAHQDESLRRWGAGLHGVPLFLCDGRKCLITMAAEGESTYLRSEAKRRIANKVLQDKDAARKMEVRRAERRQLAASINASLLKGGAEMAVEDHFTYYPSGVRRPMSTQINRLDMLKDELSEDTSALLRDAIIAREEKRQEELTVKREARLAEDAKLAKSITEDLPDSGVRHVVSEYFAKQPGGGRRQESTQLNMLTNLEGKLSKETCALLRDEIVEEEARRLAEREAEEAELAKSIADRKRKRLEISSMGSDYGIDCLDL